MEIVDDQYKPLRHRFIEELADFDGTLEELGLIVARLALEHGPKSQIMLDAGHSNVSCVLVTEADMADMMRRKALAEERKLKAKEKRERKLYEELKAKFEAKMEPVNEQCKAV